MKVESHEREGKSKYEWRELIRVLMSEERRVREAH